MSPNWSNQENWKKSKQIILNIKSKRTLPSPLPPRPLPRPLPLTPHLPRFVSAAFSRDLSLPLCLAPFKWDCNCSLHVTWTLHILHSNTAPSLWRETQNQWNSTLISDNFKTYFWILHLVNVVGQQLLLVSYIYY